MNKCGEYDLQARLCVRFPVHFACFTGDTVSLAELLRSGKFDLYEEDSQRGWTPAHWASYFGKLDCLQHLLAAGINLNVATQQLHQTPAHVAAEAGQSQCLAWLLEHGASVEIQDIHGGTPAHKAARSGNIDCLQLIKVKGGCFRFPFSVCNNEGKTVQDVFSQHMDGGASAPNESVKHQSMQCGGGDHAQIGQLSRKRTQQAMEAMDFKRPKLREVEDTNMFAQEGPWQSKPDPEVKIDPMDMCDETYHPQQAAAIAAASLAAQEFMMGESSNHKTYTACGDSQNLHPNGSNKMNDCSTHTPSPPASYHAEAGAYSSAMEQHQAISQQSCYERLSEKTYTTLCYGHFF